MAIGSVADERVAVAVDAVDHAGLVQLELLRHRAQDPDVGLVVDEQVDLAERESGAVHGVERGLGHVVDGRLEGVVALHADDLAPRGRRVSKVRPGRRSAGRCRRSGRLRRWPATPRRHPHRRRRSPRCRDPRGRRSGSARRRRSRARSQPGRPRPERWPARARTGSRCRRRPRPSPRRGARRARWPRAARRWAGSRRGRPWPRARGRARRPRPPRHASARRPAAVASRRDAVAVRGPAALVHAGAVDDPLLGHACGLGDHVVAHHLVRHDHLHRRHRDGAQATLESLGTGRERRSARESLACAARAAQAPAASIASGASASTPSRDLRTRPVSTRPGPISTKRPAPRLSRARMTSSQRTGLVMASHQAKADVVEGLCGHAGQDRHARLRAPRSSSTSARKGSTAGSMSGEWKAPATGRRLARTSRSASARLGLVESAAAPGEHQLVGRVVVGHGQLRWPAATSWIGARSPRARTASIPPSPVVLGGLLHQPPARGHETQAVVGASGSGGHERADLAERVAGHQAGLGAIAQLLPAGEGRAEDRGLRPARALARRARRLGSPRRASSSRSGRWRATRSRMSGVWLPCPGKSSASESSLEPYTETFSVTAAASPAAAETPRSGGRAQRAGGAQASGEAEPLGALHGLRAVAHAELAVERARVLLDRVRREEQALGDLLVGRAGWP